MFSYYRERYACCVWHLTVAFYDRICSLAIECVLLLERERYACCVWHLTVEAQAVEVCCLTPVCAGRRACRRERGDDHGDILFFFRNKA